MKKRTLGLAMCGSFCTFSRVLDAFETLDQELYELVPIMSQASFETDSRFGPAAQFRERLETLCGREIVHTIKRQSRSARKKLLDALVIMPCTGNTLAKLAAGIADGPVTLAAKAHLRNERPVIVAVSTNDALAGNAANLGRLLNRRGYYFVPFGQDSAFKKPRSPRRGFHKAAADRRIRAARRTGSADAVRDACWIGSCSPLRSVQPAAVFVGAEASELFEGAGKMTAVGIADEVDDIADLEAGVCQQLLGLFDADGIEQVVIALLFYCIFRIRVRGSINFPNRQCCQFKAVNLMQNSLKFKLARQDAPNHRKSSANS